MIPIEEIMIVIIRELNFAQDDPDSKLQSQHDPSGGHDSKPKHLTTALQCYTQPELSLIYGTHRDQQGSRTLNL